MRAVPWSEGDADSASFLAILPPDPITEVIREEQARSGIATTVPPHVTVKAQPGLHDRSTWSGPLRRLFDSIDPFEVRLGPTGWFGSDILYLAVSGGGVSDLHGQILRCLERAGVTERFEYEDDEFLPHLTVGAPWAAPRRSTLEESAARLDRLTFEPFYAFEVVEFHRPSPDAPYALGDSIPLRLR